jgi:aspartate/methionine/tyrosine aminotransferase
MFWAKTQSRAPYNLATSGVGAFPLRDLPLTPDILEINGDNRYGYAPLTRAIVEKCGVEPDCIVTAAGASMANHLAMAALIHSGNEVLIERPAYELLLSTALYLDAAVRRFDRREENGWAIDPEDIRRAMTPNTKLIVITNLHNPSSAYTPEPVLRAIGDLARSVGARVLVDEVYLDAVYDNTPRTSYHLGREFVVTSSLTKVYGLSGLRCGWIAAEPDLARSIWRLNDLFGSIAAYPLELMSAVAFEHLAEIRDRARRVVEADRAALSAFLDVQTAVSAVRTTSGTTAFLRLQNGNADEFLARLRAEYDTSAVPGRFFEMPAHFRIGMGVDSFMFREGLRRIGLALAGGRS